MSIADTSVARNVAAAFGSLAGMLETDELSGVELILGNGPIDLIAWTTLPKVTS